MQKVSAPGSSPQTIADGDLVRKQPLVNDEELPYSSNWDDSEISWVMYPRAPYNIGVQR